MKVPKSNIVGCTVTVKNPLLPSNLNSNANNQVDDQAKRIHQLTCCHRNNNLLMFHLTLSVNTNATNSWNQICQESICHKYPKQCKNSLTCFSLYNMSLANYKMVLILACWLDFLGCLFFNNETVNLEQKWTVMIFWSKCD